MRISTSMGVTAVALLMGLGLSGCAKEMHQTVTINEDGTAKTVMDMVVDRTVIEQQIQMMERWRGGPEEGTDEEVPAEGAEPPAPKKEEKKPELTPAEKSAKLAADIKTMLTENGPWGQGEPPEGVAMTVDNVEVKEDTVHIVVSVTFKDLKAMVANMRATGMGGGSIRLEKDEKGKLRLVLSTVSSGRYRRMEITRMEQQLAAVKATGSWKFVMPGKVLSSSLPDVKDNAASITFDTAKQESVDALKKLLSNDVVVVAEPGRLKMDDLPLDSVKLASARYQPRPGPGHDLPLVDAAPGFKVKALSVTTTSVHYFDGAEKFPDDLDSMMSSNQGNACILHVRLFPPEERRILAVEDIKATKAVDDHNREVKPFAEADENGRNRFRSEMVGMRGEQKSVDVELRLVLPQPDAEALEKVQGEAIVVSFSKWKEHAVQDPKADPKLVVDLGDVLPGATMVIKEVKAGKQRGNEGGLVIEVKGPPAVESLKFDLKPEEIPDEERGFPHSYVSSERTSQVQGKTVRTLTLSMQQGGQAGGKQVLTVQYPDEIKHERLTFTLEAVDLF